MKLKKNKNCDYVYSGIGTTQSRVNTIRNYTDQLTTISH